MRREILEELRKIEEQEKAEIILAVESGSRAWGFASQDSDYDVRFIYVRKEEDYMKLGPFRDVIEWCCNETLDISGWDLRKALQLLYKSNPTIFEWFASPIVYMEREEAAFLRELLPKYFSMKKSLYHYWHMAVAVYTGFLQGDMVRIKKYFYALRPLLAAKWILDKKSAPPMLFEALVEAELEEVMRPEIYKLVEMKKSMPEIGMIPKIHSLSEYIDRTISEIKAIATTIEDVQLSWDMLDDTFLRIVRNEI